MKRLLVLSFIVAGAVGLASAGLAFAGQGFNTPFQRGELGIGNGIGNSVMLENKAAVLGITVDELKTQLTAGKTFYALAQEKGLSFDEMHKRMKERVTTQLTTLVKNGDITQKQMDRELQNMDERAAEAMINGGGRGGMMGGGGFGRMGR